MTVPFVHAPLTDEEVLNFAGSEIGASTGAEKWDMLQRLVAQGFLSTDEARVRYIKHLREHLQGLRDVRRSYAIKKVVAGDSLPQPLVDWISSDVGRHSVEVAQFWEANGDPDEGWNSVINIDEVIHTHKLTVAAFLESDSLIKRNPLDLPVERQNYSMLAGGKREPHAKAK